MKKKTKIIIGIIVAIVCVLAILIGATFVRYKKDTNKELPDEKYDDIYKDEKDVKEEIEPIQNGDNHFSFTQVKSDQTILSQEKEIAKCKDEVTASSAKMKEMESFANHALEEFFAGYTEAFPKKHKVGNTNTGYDFQVQNKNGLGENVYVFVTNKDFYGKLPEATESNIDDVKAKIYYTHNRRSSIPEKRTVDQYSYETVFVANGLTFFVQIEFEGFDYQIHMVETTKEETSKQVADLISKLASN